MIDRNKRGIKPTKNEIKTIKKQKQKIKKRDTGTGCLKKEKTAKFIKSPPQSSKKLRQASDQQDGGRKQRTDEEEATKGETT